MSALTAGDEEPGAEGDDVDLSALLKQRRSHRDRGPDGSFSVTARLGAAQTPLQSGVALEA
jgi:hypothetical protein